MSSKVYIILIFTLFVILVSLIVAKGMLNVSSMYIIAVKHYNNKFENPTIIEFYKPTTHSYWNFYYNGNYYWTYIVVRSNKPQSQIDVVTSFPLIEPSKIIQSNYDGEYYYYRILLKTHQKPRSIEWMRIDKNGMILFTQVKDVRGQLDVQITGVKVKNNEVLPAIVLPALTFNLLNEYSKALVVFLQNTGDDAVLNSVDLMVDNNQVTNFKLFRADGSKLNPGDLIKSGESFILFIPNFELPGNEFNIKVNANEARENMSKTVVKKVKVKIMNNAGSSIISEQPHLIILKNPNPTSNIMDVTDIHKDDNGVYLATGLYGFEFNSELTLTNSGVINSQALITSLTSLINDGEVYSTFGTVVFVDNGNYKADIMWVKHDFNTIQFEKYYSINNIPAMLLSTVKTNDDGYLLNMVVQASNSIPVLMKLTSDGSVQWVKSYQFSDNNIGAQFTGINEVNGGFIVTGLISNSSSSAVGSIISYIDDNGNVIWMKEHNYSLGMSKILVDGNNFYFAVTTTSHQNSNDIKQAVVLKKYDFSGNLVDSKVFITNPPVTSNNIEPVNAELAGILLTPLSVFKTKNNDLVITLKYMSGLVFIKTTPSLELSDYKVYTFGGTYEVGNGVADENYIALSVMNQSENSNTQFYYATQGQYYIIVMRVGDDLTIPSNNMITENTALMTETDENSPYYGLTDITNLVRVSDLTPLTTTETANINPTILNAQQNIENGGYIIIQS